MWNEESSSDSDPDAVAEAQKEAELDWSDPEENIQMGEDQGHRLAVQNLDWD